MVMEPLRGEDPRVVGPYRLVARLGAGGMGQVFLGFSPAGRPVAVKVVHAELARDQEFLVRFRREVAAARKVSGAYTAAVVDAGDGDPPWFATTLVAGPSLADTVEQHGPLPEISVSRLAAGLAEALAEVHARGLVHRDLKPSNLLLATDGPRLIDFGISRALDGTVITGTGMVVGTPAFMSPEQASGTPVGPASDVFSYGGVLTFAATGSGPFGDGSPTAMIYRVVHDEPMIDGLPGALRGLVTRCLAKRPDDRATLPELMEIITANLAPAPSAMSFWPESVADFIASYQARFAAETQAISALSTPERPEPTSRHEPTSSPADPPVLTEVAPIREKQEEVATITTQRANKTPPPASALEPPREPAARPLEEEPPQESIGQHLGNPLHLAGNPRMRAWQRRALIAIVVAVVFSVIVSWRIGLTLAVLAAIVDTIYWHRRARRAQRGPGVRWRNR
jgi:eukaryotic-like serine/threonine-protein kinase